MLLRAKDAARYLMKLHMLPIHRKLDELRNTIVFYTLDGASQTVFVKVKGLFHLVIKCSASHLSHLDTD